MKIDHLIAGKPVPGRRYFETVNPADQQVLAQVAAGGSVELFGIQVEAQLGASDYKRTAARSGVYSKARFGSDQITVTAQGAESYDAVVQIVSTEN